MLARKRTWITGGILLLVVAVVQLSRVQLPVPPVVSWVGTVAFAAACVVFAFGWAAAGSVTARRPLGTGALVGLGLWQFAMPVFGIFGFSIAITNVGLWDFLYVTIQIVGLALAIVATVQIMRTAVVPRPWNGAPLWALIAHAVPQIIVAVMGASGVRDQSALVMVSTVGSNLSVVALVFLGVLALVLALRPGTTTRVFPSL